MTISLKRIFHSLGLRPKLPPSRVFVSVNVIKAMRHTGLTRKSTKVIIRISIWTCLILVLLFLVIYTVILAYVDKQFHPSLIDAPGVYRKAKFQGRFRLNNNSKAYLRSNQRNHFHFDFASTAHRKSVWNSSLYYNEQQDLPQCKWQTVFRILVTSSPENYQRRHQIRNTWCNPKNFPAIPDHAWHCIFLVGETDNNTRNTQTREESALHNDILLGNYVDSYRNLTLKVIHGFNWSANYCPSSYIVKTDDDCFVNAKLFHDFLLHYNDKTSSLYAGSIVVDKNKLKVIRGDDKKWSVRYEEYSNEYYPPYASGTGYVFSTDVAKQLVSESIYVTPIANEDAYVGIVMSHLGVRPVRSSRFVISSSGLTICNFLYVFIVHDVKMEQQQEMMQKALDSERGCSHQAITTWD